jgi:protocatechuate 3,4-dioxygenase beta subunit
MKREQPTRREALLIIGATGAELVACGSDGTPDPVNTAGKTSAGSAGMPGGAGRGGAPSVVAGAGAGGHSDGGVRASAGQGGADVAGQGGASDTGGGGAAGAEDTGGGGNGGAGGEAGGPPTAECTTKPEQTLGPYPNKANLNRSDIRSGQAGTVLRLKLRVLTSILCMPISGASVELWQCNALGDYSEYSDFGTADQNWLRGFQITNASGVVEFVTIYPGWYPGRSVHVHFRIKRQGHADFVSQLYFDDSMTDQVLAQAPYTGHPGTRPRNEDDGIFVDGGSELTLDVKTVGQALSATFELGI